MHDDPAHRPRRPGPPPRTKFDGCATVLFGSIPVIFIWSIVFDSCTMQQAIAGAVGVSFVAVIGLIGYRILRASESTINAVAESKWSKTLKEMEEGPAPLIQRWSGESTRELTSRLRSNMSRERIAAVVLLERRGATEAIDEIQEAIEHFGDDVEFVEAAARAVRQIPNVANTRGQISVSEDGEAGTLSAPETEVGALSETTRDDH